MSNNGFGVVPMSWSELNSWASARKITLTWFEIDSIMSMSKAYVDSFNENNEQLTPPPFEMVVVDVEAVADKVGSVLRQIAARKRSAKALK